MMTKPTRLAVLLGGLGLFATLPAGATLIVDGLRARAETFAGGVTHSDGPYLTTPTVSANSSAFDGGSNAYSVAWGDIDGFYGARASVHGNGSSSGEFRRTWEITNNTLVPQSYSFSFYIYPGRINANDHGLGGEGFAAYELDILFGGSTLFHSAAKVEHDGTLTQTGTPLTGATHSGSYYWWSGTSVTLNLGILAPGQTSLLQYDLVAYAFGKYGIGYCYPESAS